MKKHLILFGILIVFGFGQVNITPPSVASTDDPLALMNNPAGLAYHDHKEVIMFGNIDPDGFTKDFALFRQDGSNGFSYQWDASTGTNIWSNGTAFKVGESHVVGFNYTFNNSKWKSGSLDIGWMHRPFTFLSIGAKFENAWSGTNKLRNINTGLAVQNKTGRLGAAIDKCFRLDADRDPIDDYYTASIFFEPISGIRLNGYTDLSAEEDNFGISMSLSLKNYGIETHTRKDQYDYHTVGIRFTRNPYRTVLDKISKPKKEKKYVRMKLDGYFIEEPEVKKSKFIFDFQFPEIPFLGLGESIHGRQLKKFIDEVDALTADESISGLIIDLGYVRGGFSKIYEIRNALNRFHDSGKRIIVYNKFGLSNVDVYLLSMADEIYIHEQASVDLRGILVSMEFYRGFLDTLSIVPEVWRISPYKTAGDAFLNKKMSPEMRENYSQLLESLYEQIVSGIAEGKNWSLEKTKSVIDAGPYDLAEKAKEA